MLHIYSFYNYLQQINIYCSLIITITSYGAIKMKYILLKLTKNKHHHNQRATFFFVT